MRGAADTTLQKDMKETQPLVFQPLTSPFDFLTVENEIFRKICVISPEKQKSKKAALLRLFPRKCVYSIKEGKFAN